MIVGISGKRGVGKTTSANYLVKKYGFVRIGFADDLRELAKTFFTFTDRDFNLNKEKKFKHYDWTTREFLLHLGELMRYHDENYWTNRALAKCVDTTKNYVIDDLRFSNEAEAIKKQGGKLIRIERYEKLNIYGKDLDIISETSLDTYPFEFCIPRVRNTSITELEHQLDSILGEIYGNS